MTTRTGPADAARTSLAIKAARVLCIMGLVYIHSWTGLTGIEQTAMAHSDQSVFRTIVMEIAGRSSVPLLSAISGYLVVSSALRRGYFDFVRTKARVILLPMVAWNALAILLVSGSAWLFTMPAPLPRDAMWFADELLALTRANDINVQMPFLRDLFLCMLAAPLLVRAKGWQLAIAIAAVIAWLATGWTTLLLQRPQILLFFLIGIVAFRRDLPPMLARVTPWVVWPAFLSLAALKIAVVLALPAAVAGFAPTPPQVDLVLRFAGALACWQAAWWVAGSRWATAFVKLEPYMFLLFCAHLLMMWLGGPTIGLMIGKLGEPLYPALLLAMPLLTLAATFGVAALLRRLPPAIGDALSGGRLPQRAPAARSLAPSPARL